MLAYLQMLRPMCLNEAVVFFPQVLFVSKWRVNSRKYKIFFPWLQAGIK